MPVNYEICILGAGVAGVTAGYRISKEYPGLETIIVDMGRPFRKRRRQLDGALGCLPNSDGKLYLNDLNKLTSILNKKQIKSSNNYFMNLISKVHNPKIIKDHLPSRSLENRLNKHEFSLELNNYIQLYPEAIHSLSKLISDECEKYKHVNYSFDNEVISITKKDNEFIVETQLDTIICKKLVLALGRSGWRFTKGILSQFNLIKNNNNANFGIKIEVQEQILRDMNGSMCSLKRDNISIGPFLWHGTVIPEDHVDFVIASFRSNENRWKTDKVSFDLIMSKTFENQGFEQTERLAKLAFILCNDRVAKEKVSAIINKRSKISIIPEYNWLVKTLKELEEIFPNLLSKASFHIPTIHTFIPEINIKDNLETDEENLFVIGESCGVNGILAAGVTGSLIAKSLSGKK